MSAKAFRKDVQTRVNCAPGAFYFKMMVDIQSTSPTYLNHTILDMAMEMELTTDEYRSMEHFVQQQRWATFLLEDVAALTRH